VSIVHVTEQTTIDDSDVKQQMTIVENGVNYNVKRFNDLKIGNERLVQVLKQRLDELEYEKKSFEALDAMKKAETEEGKRITALQAEIDQVDSHITERTHYVRKLEHMLRRLKSNQLKFDAHLVGMEDTMRAIRKDGAEVKLMRRGLDAGLAKAAIVLEETKYQSVISSLCLPPPFFGFHLQLIDCYLQTVDCS
jgi:DNA repair exonuclease SbcCD ATPase subunit